MNRVPYKVPLNKFKKLPAPRKANRAERTNFTNGSKWNIKTELRQLSLTGQNIKGKTNNQFQRVSQASESKREANVRGKTHARLALCIFLAPSSRFSRTCALTCLTGLSLIITLIFTSFWRLTNGYSTSSWVWPPSYSVTMSLWRHTRRLKKVKKSRMIKFHILTIKTNGSVQKQPIAFKIWRRCCNRIWASKI